MDSISLVSHSRTAEWRLELKEGVGEFMRRRLIIAVVSSAVAVAGLGVGGATTAYAACSLPDVCSGSSTVTATFDCNGAITLTIPNGTANGVYTGTFVVTLNQ